MSTQYTYLKVFRKSVSMTFEILPSSAVTSCFSMDVFLPYCATVLFHFRGNELSRYQSQICLYFEPPVTQGQKFNKCRIYII